MFVGKEVVSIPDYYRSSLGTRLERKVTVTTSQHQLLTYKTVVILPVIIFTPFHVTTFYFLTLCRFITIPALNKGGGGGGMWVRYLIVAQARSIMPCILAGAPEPVSSCAEYYGLL